MRRHIGEWMIGAVAVLGMVCRVAVAGAAETKVRVNVFPGLSNLAIYAAQAQGASRMP